MEARLFSQGLRLRHLGDGTGVLTWPDLAVLVGNPATLWQLVEDAQPLDYQRWKVRDELQAQIVDRLGVLIYQNTGKKKNPFDPWPRPTDDKAATDEDAPKGKLMKIKALNKALGWE